MYACHQSKLRTMELLVELAVSHTAVIVLDEAVKTNHHRVNALLHFVERKLENKMAHIKTEIDELKRAEFLRPSKCKLRKKRPCCKSRMYKPTTSNRLHEIRGQGKRQSYATAGLERRRFALLNLDPRQRGGYQGFI